MLIAHMISDLYLRFQSIYSSLFIAELHNEALSVKRRTRHQQGNQRAADLNMVVTRYILSMSLL